MKTISIMIFLLGVMYSLTAATISDIWNSNDVMVCRYADSLTVMNVQSGEEAAIKHDENISDICLDKSGKKLYILYDISAPGKNYEDPDIHSVKIKEMTLPDTNLVTITSFSATNPREEMGLGGVNLLLDKKGNLSIIMSYGLDEPVIWKQTYDLTTKKLSVAQKATFYPQPEVYQYKGVPVVTNKAGKYYSLENGDCYDLYTKDAEGNDVQLTDVVGGENLPVIKEPLYYCVSPDSTFILFGYRYESYPSVGSTNFMAMDGSNLQRLSGTSWLGYAFVPYWTSDHRLVYIHKGDASYEDVKPTLTFIDKDGNQTTTKEWEDYWTAPYSYIYRYK